MALSIAVLAILGVLLLVWAWTRRRRQAHPQKPGTASPYHSVGLQVGAAACQAARDLGSRRFLAREAPALPLSACSAAACQCKYVHFDDRRAGERRDLGRPRMRNLQSADWRERRRGQGRRKADQRHYLDQDAMQAAIAEKRRQRARGSGRWPPK